MDCSGAEGEEKTPEKAFLSKKAALLQLVDQRPVSKTIVFCNKVSLRLETLDKHSKNCFIKFSCCCGSLCAYICTAVLVQTFAENEVDT